MNPRAIEDLATAIYCLDGVTVSTGASIQRGTLRINFEGGTEALRNVWKLMPCPGVTPDRFTFYVNKARFKGAAHSCLPRVLGEPFPSKRQRQGDDVFRILWDIISWPGCGSDTLVTVRLARALYQIEQNLKQLTHP